MFCDEMGGHMRRSWDNSRGIAIAQRCLGAVKNRAEMAWVWYGYGCLCVGEVGSRMCGSAGKVG